MVINLPFTWELLVCLRGPILSLFFFVIIIDDIVKVIDDYNSLMYADNRKIFCCVDFERLQRQIDALNSWCNANKLDLNVNSYIGFLPTLELKS